MRDGGLAVPGTQTLRRGPLGQAHFRGFFLGPRTSAPFHRSGKNEPFIFDHSQVGPSLGAVRPDFSSSVTTISD